MRFPKNATLLIVVALLLAVEAASGQAYDNRSAENAWPGTSFNSLVNFDVTNGLNPDAVSLVQGLDGNLYGTTIYGGANLSCNPKQVGCGTVFKITPSGALTTLYSFCSTTNCTDGSYPIGGLILATDGNLYGTTSGGGSIGFGTVFKVTGSGTVTTLYNFCSQTNCVDGREPSAPLIQGTDGSLYGTTVLGGTGGCGGCHGGGVAFKLTLAGILTVIHDFCTGTCTDYGDPSNQLVQGSDGNFYSVITGRSGYSGGNVFKMTPAGVVTILYTFCAQTNCTDGAFPVGNLVQGSDGNFYGLTSGGGAFGDGIFYKITTTGKPTTLLSFDYETTGDLGALPQAGLILATDGHYYGTTFQGGGGCVFGCGTVLELTSAGALTTLHLFDGSGANSDGAGPYGLYQHTNGNFYGATNAGGTSNDGALFDLSDGLGPFVKLLPNFGKVGATFVILGQGLTGATAVSLDGVAAKFHVYSDTYMTAIVPAGALTGPVRVTASSGTLTSDRTFLVRPQIKSFSPTGGVVGTSVTITGVSFTQTKGVAVGGKSTTFTVNSDTELTANVPVGAKTGLPITVATAGGTTSYGTFSVVPQPLSFTPTSGPVGTSVTITGNSFTAATEVTFGGVAATTFQVVKDTQVTALVPTGAVTGPIAITTAGGTGTTTTNFTVTP
jgi:uncharacterized repeat protein (TIGR03803 family)